MEELARLFNFTTREDTLAAGLTVTVRGQTIVLSPGQELASVAGRLVSLSAPPTRDGRAWFVPTDFLNRALASVAGTRIDVRRPSRLVVVGDIRVPRIGGRLDVQGGLARLTLDIAPTTAHAVTQEGNRLLIRFEADALGRQPAPTGRARADSGYPPRRQRGDRRGSRTAFRVLQDFRSARRTWRQPHRARHHSHDRPGRASGTTRAATAGSAAAARTVADRRIALRCGGCRARGGRRRRTWVGRIGREEHHARRREAIEGRPRSAPRHPRHPHPRRRFGRWPRSARGAGEQQQGGPLHLTPRQRVSAVVGHRRRGVLPEPR